MPKHTLILKARHICCAHLGPRSSTLHVAAHLVPHGSTFGMSRHACNPTATARRRGRWAWSLSKAQIRPAAPVRNTYCSRSIELSTWERIIISVTSGSEQRTLYTQVPCLCICSVNSINMRPRTVVWQRKTLCIAAYLLHGFREK